MKTLRINRKLLLRQRDELLESNLSQETKDVLFDLLVELDILTERSEVVSFMEGE